MNLYRVANRINKTSRSFVLEISENNGRNWRKCDGPFKHKNSAIEKRRRLVDRAREEYRGDIGGRIMASKIFCKGVL